MYVGFRYENITADRLSGKIALISCKLKTTQTNKDNPELFQIQVCGLSRKVNFCFTQKNKLHALPQTEPYGRCQFQIRRLYFV